jgi:protein phosphatase 1 regulatory subunit 7
MNRINRLQSPIKLDFDEIIAQTSTGIEVVIQFPEMPKNAKLFDEVNELCKVCNKNLCIRFYGHYEAGFDCSLLKRLSNVKSLFLDCLQSVSNFHELKNLTQLEKLNIGIFNLDEHDFLSWENLKEISYLCLVETRSNGIDLKYLEDYQKIETLLLNGHNKNIEALGAVSNLTNVSLSVSSKVSIAFLNNLQRLRKLTLILGGRKNLDDLENYRLEELEIIRVRGFNRIDNISEFKNLRRLWIEDQIQLEEIKFKNENSYLNDLRILNCKSLCRLENIIFLNSLERMYIYKTALDFDDFMRQQLPNALKVLAFNTSKATLNRKIRAKLNQLGYLDGLDQSTLA